MRTAAERWVLLSTLLMSVERCLEANARIDATMEALTEFPGRRRGRPRSTNYAESTSVGARLDTAALRVDQELDRLTSELLLLDLERKTRARGRPSPC